MVPSPVSLSRAALLSVPFAATLASAAFDISSSKGIKDASATIVYDLLDVYYTGNLSGNTPGILPGPPPAGDYYWWEGGAMWGTLIDYWQYTGDDSYNDVIIEAMTTQVGDGRDYMPREHIASLGNDDQGFWGMSAMLAAEVNFPNPPDDQPQWLALAQAVFRTQTDPSRHDEYCGGGLRWQIPMANRGYDYKNTIANGCFFNLGARLARYLDNSTYSDWAEKTWDWLVGVKYITDEYDVYDGGHVGKNCTDINKLRYSYNPAILIQGLAHLYNYTEDDKWKTALEGMTKKTLETFFPDDIAFELECEPSMTCTTDMFSFKGYVHRWLMQATQLAPFLSETIRPVLKKSAEAAIKVCTGGDNGRQCGFGWAKGSFDGKIGAGEQMNAIGAISSLLVDEVSPPFTAKNGGSSKADYDAGSNSRDFVQSFPPATGGDKAGASFLTIFVLVGLVGTFAWMNMGE